MEEGDQVFCFPGPLRLGPSTSEPYCVCVWVRGVHIADQCWAGYIRVTT